MPDAIEIAGRVYAAKREKLKVRTAISDGWPDGYTNSYSSASEINNNLSGG